MYCICCKKNTVTPSLPDGVTCEEDLLWKKTKLGNDGSYYEHNINNEMVMGGIIQIIDGGYGSKHDGSRIILAICDDCIKGNLEDATLLFFDDYMYPDKYFIDKEFVEKSKKAYRRRKNLDGLV